MKTIEQEKLEGNPSRRPVNESAPMAAGKIPNPPKFLDRVGTRKYHDLVRIVGLDGMRVAGKSDGEALAMVAFAYSKFRNAQDSLDQATEFYTTPGGQIKKHPASGEVSDWWTKYQAGLSKFGMSPFDRKNVDALPGEKKKSRKQELAERREQATEKANKLKKNAANGEFIKAVG